MVYVTSDIHGNYEAYKALLSKINLSEKDCLVILGDVVDRGEHGIEILLDIMERENIILLLGNHESMMLEVMNKFAQDITEQSLAEFFPDDDFQMLSNWIDSNGGDVTLKEILELSKAKRAQIIEFLSELPSYEEITINEKNYLLVHTGFGDDFSPEKDIEDYYEYELLWTRLDYSKIYYQDKIIVSGHTPTCKIKNNPNSNYIYKENNHIALDCGCGFNNGRLGCICLNTMEEYYIEKQ